jgi:hypothetical protein
MAAAVLGIAALAAVAVFGIPAGAALAAPTVTAVAPTPAECAALPQTIAGLEGQISAAEELLQNATPAQKPGIIRRIQRLNATLAEKEARLALCPGH